MRDVRDIAAQRVAAIREQIDVTRPDFRGPIIGSSREPSTRPPRHADPFILTAAPPPPQQKCPNTASQRELPWETARPSPRQHAVQPPPA
eukprot:gene48068-63669_t